MGYSPWGHKESDTTEPLRTEQQFPSNEKKGKKKYENPGCWRVLKKPGFFFFFFLLLSYSLEKEMATHSSTLALKIPWTEELGAGYYPWDRKESGTTKRLHFLTFTVLYMSFFSSKTRSELT